MDTEVSLHKNGPSVRRPKIDVTRCVKSGHGLFNIARKTKWMERIWRVGPKRKKGTCGIPAMEESQVPLLLRVTKLVRKRGLEPRRPKALPPQDSVSTNFTTPAQRRDERYLLGAGFTASFCFGPTQDGWCGFIVACLRREGSYLVLSSPLTQHALTGGRWQLVTATALK